MLIFASDAILNEVVSHVIKGLNVDVLLVPTDANTSHQRSLERAKNGKRLIAPYLTGNSLKAFEEAKHIIQNPNYVSIDSFTRKLLSKLGYTPAQMKKISEPEKQNIHNRYASLVTFDLAH